MAAYEEGYDDERFATPVHESLHCSICLNVLRNPMQCVRNEHFFCNQCITRFLRDAQRCPSCNEPLTLQTLRPSRIIKGFVQELIMKCDNSVRGCGDSVKLENLEAHVARCEFSQVQCSNEGCEVIVNRKDQPEHEMNECNFRLARCQVCGENVNYSKRKLHCYVSRREMDEMKNEMKNEVSTVKELVLNVSKEMAKLTRSVGEVKNQMGEMKDQMGEMKDQMGEMKRKMGEMKCEMTAMKKESHRSKQEPKSDARSLGASLACFQPSVNIREDIIIAGGFHLKSVEMFSWTTRQWTLLPPMTSPGWFSSSGVYEGQMFVCGGVWRNMIETLELKKKRREWKKFQGKLPQETFGHANIIYEENLFIFGGESGGKVVNDIYKVGLVSPYSSQLVSHLPEPRAYHGAQRFGDKVAIVGGTTTGGSRGSLDRVLLYDIRHNCCRTLAPLPFAVCVMATVAWGDNIIIIGGEDKNGNALNTVVSYNITNEKSKMLPSMKRKRNGCSAVVTGNVIVVMGGGNKEEKTLKSVECFDFDLYTWKELPPMNEARQWASAAVVKCVQ